MKKTMMRLGLACVATVGFSAAAHAACTTTVDKDDLTHDQINGLYECLKEEMQAGYAKSEDPVGTDYKTWKPAFTVPGGRGFHGQKFLTTFVNDIGFDEYVKYSDENPVMPVGTVIAKESFFINKKGEAKITALFLMTKVAAGEADEFGNWIYGGIQKSGKAMKVSQKFCHDCHGAYDDQDSLGYPEEDKRISVE